MCTSTPAMHCRRIDNLHRMEGECEKNQKGGILPFLKIYFHSCVWLLFNGTTVYFAGSVYI